MKKEPAFNVVDKVQIRGSGRKGMVMRPPDWVGNQYEYLVFFNADEQRTYTEDSLIQEQMEGVKEVVPLLKSWNLGSPRDFFKFLTLLKLKKPLTDNIYAFLASRTQFEPYQFKPLLKFLNSPYRRILIADEVGLGKTIEAGIILIELNARKPLRNGLIVCPYSLQTKWKDELESRFNLLFEILDGSGLQQFFKGYETGQEREKFIITSLSLIRRDEYLTKLVDLNMQFDIVIIDEAHHMRNDWTNSFEAGKNLSNCAENMILLTATPLHLGRNDLFNLLHILVPEEFNNKDLFADLIRPNEYLNNAIRELRKKFPPDSKEVALFLQEVERTSQRNRFLNNPYYVEVVTALAQKPLSSKEEVMEIYQKLLELNTLAHVFTRTKKQDVANRFPFREAHVVPVDLSPEEMEFYYAVTDYVRDLFIKQHGYSMGISFATIMPQRQVSSCIPAMKEYLEDIITNREIAGENEDSKDLDIENEEPEESREKIKLVEADVLLLKKLLEAWKKTEGMDTKFDKFYYYLTNLEKEGTNKIIVFSFFRKTIDYLERRLKELHFNSKKANVFKIYGGFSLEERNDIIERFRNLDGFSILLSSEVGGEGLDFQFCSCMFNYDLPWNPMTVEQRIGRIDRFGQEAEKVKIYNMSVKRTIEANIFERLYERIGIFERSIGDLEAILGNEIKELTREIFQKKLTSEEEKRRADQIADVIIYKQHENDLIDQERNKFLGQDDYFTEQISKIGEEKRFITSEEVQVFVTDFFSHFFPGIKLTPSPKVEKAFRLLVGGKDREQFYEFIQRYLHKHQDRHSFRFLTKVAKSSDMIITFDSEVASKYPTKEFFNIFHPAVKAMVEQALEVWNLLPTGGLKITSAENRGEYLYFIFLLEVQGYTKSLEMHSVVVSKDVRINDLLSENLLTLIQKEKSIQGIDNVKLRDLWIEEAYKIGREYIAELRKSRKEQLQIKNAKVINDRIESLKQSTEIEIARLTRLLQEAKNPKIITMREGQFRNARINLDNKVSELTQRQELTVSSELVAGGYLVVE